MSPSDVGNMMFSNFIYFIVCVSDLSLLILIPIFADLSMVAKLATSERERSVGI